MILSFDMWGQDDDIDYFSVNKDKDKPKPFTPPIKKLAVKERASMPAMSITESERTRLEKQASAQIKKPKQGLFFFHPKKDRAKSLSTSSEFSNSKSKKEIEKSAKRNDKLIKSKKYAELNSMDKSELIELTLRLQEENRNMRKLALQIHEYKLN